MVSTNLIRLAASAAMLARVNGQAGAAIAFTTITLTTFTTVGLSSSSSWTVDPSITAMTSTTPLEVIPITVTTIITIRLPGQNTSSSSAGIVPALASLNDSPYNNAAVAPVSTGSAVTGPSLVTTTTCNFDGICRITTVPAVIPLPSMVTTLTDCYNRVCSPVATLTYPVPPCSIVTRTNAPAATSIPLLSASSGSSAAIRSNTTTAVSSSSRAGTPTSSVTRAPTLVTTTSLDTTNRSSSLASAPPSRTASSASISAATSGRPPTTSSPRLSTPQQTPSRPPSATTRPVITSPTVVVVAGESSLKPFSAIPLICLLGAVAAGMGFM
ncbi:hypothetical protein LX36DRAFT_701397 [Colletotrichum falcatum]|nr:hypothetical protein LX36DRAFT_701397 [Colletotrichum falcatum]